VENKLQRRNHSPQILMQLVFRNYSSCSPNGPTACKGVNFHITFHAGKAGPLSDARVKLLPWPLPTIVLLVRLRLEIIWNIRLDDKYLANFFLSV